MSNNFQPKQPLSNRQQLRAHFRRLRNQLSAEDQRTASQMLAQRLTDVVQQNPQIKTVAAYLSNDGEADLQLFINAMWEAGVRVALPVLHPVVPGHLLFLEYTPQTPMCINQFGIAEPKLNCQNVIPLTAVNLICMPLVAFDRSGNRLGMGGGFYDRTLACLQPDTHPELQLMGIAHDCQQANDIPAESWDIPLPQVVIPSKHWQFQTDSSKE